jgi:hypothetical protein
MKGKSVIHASKISLHTPATINSYDPDNPHTQIFVEG